MSTTLREEYFVHCVSCVPVLSLLSTLDGGTEQKRLVDAIVDNCESPSCSYVARAES